MIIPHDLAHGADFQLGTRPAVKLPNANLHRAKVAKNDEFYTQLPDVENELKHYWPHFRDATVLCNADDPRASAFFHYFSYQFEALGLKRLIATCYKGQRPDQMSQNDADRGLYLEYTGDKNANRVPDVEEVGVRSLEGDGDFRSPECIELLKQADIVITNPPFSLFREFLALLIEHGKKFLILGSANAITYKEVFPLIRDGKVWLGRGSGDMAFRVPDYYESRETRHWEDADGRKWRSLGNACWFTNLDHERRHEDLVLWRTYRGHEADYPRYDNYDAIEVSKVREIPKDYAGLMGVPITFLDKFNPDQFEIVGNEDTLGIPKGRGYVAGRRMYGRILVRNKKVGQ